MKNNLKVFAVFALFGLLIFWPVFAGKVNLNGNLLVSFYRLYGQNLPFQDTGWDQLRIYYPFYKVTFEQLRHGVVPLWNPYAFSGHPHAADFQSAVFYPLNILGLFLPLGVFWHILRITPGILASFFTFLYLGNVRVGEKKRFSRVSAIFGSITFGFSPFIVTWGEEVVMAPHSIIWLPLILWTIDRYQVTKGRRNLLVIALSTGASLLGGYMQTSIYMFLFIGAYVLIISNYKKLLLDLRFIASFVLGVGISAIQLVPSAELFFNAARSQIALTSKLSEFLIPPETLITYLIPDFFGSPTTGNFFRRGAAQYYEGILFVGVAAFLFAVLAMFYKKKDRFIWFLIAAFLVSMLTVIDTPISRWFLTLPIPFLSTSIPNRVLFIPAFCLAVLASIGMDLWVREKVRILGLVSFFAFIFFLLGLELWLSFRFGGNYFHLARTSLQNIGTSSRNMVIPLCFFAITVIFMANGSAWRKRVFASWLVLIFAVFNLYYFSQKYLTFSEEKNIFPNSDVLSFIVKSQNFDRSWDVGVNYFPNNLASYYFLYWPGGYDSLNNRSYSEFSYAMQGNDVSEYIFRADAGMGLGGAYDLFETPGGEQRRKLMDLVGVRYLVGDESEQQVLSLHKFKKVYTASDSSSAVFENEDVMPRAFLASNYEGPPPLSDVTNMTTQQIDAQRRKLIFNRLQDSAFDFRNVIILEKPSPISPQFGPGEARIVRYSPNEVVVDTMSREPKMLMLTDNYYPGWKAAVDGQSTQILRADYTFRAVPLGPGSHTVRFYYDPWSFKAGTVISILSLIGLGFLVSSKFKF